MTEPTKHTSIDKILEDLFAEIDPDQIIPDENSYSADRSRQHKAPDHFLFDRRILVERKTLNAAQGVFLERFNKTTREQGEQFIVYGEYSVNAIFNEMGDPQRALNSFSKMTTNKLETRIKEARDKFREHAAATGVYAASRFVICSEDGDASINDGKLYEKHIAEMFFNRSLVRDKTGLIDSIIYIRDPAYTISRDNGHWFKWVSRRSVTNEQRKDISWFGNLVYAKFMGHFAASGRKIGEFANPVELMV